MSTIITDFFFEQRPSRGLSDLILTPEVEAVCRRLVEEHGSADFLRSMNVEPRHLVLLTGQSGNGKSALAEALACELALPMLVVRYEGLIARYLGETAARLSRLFERARVQQCVLFFDELDLIALEPEGMEKTGKINPVLVTLMRELDSLPSHVMVVAAARDRLSVSSAISRRFEISLALGRPTLEQGEEWLRRFEARVGGPLDEADRESLPERIRQLKASFADLDQFGHHLRRRHVMAARLAGGPNDDGESK